MAEDERDGYTWESGYEKTWESLQEDEHGSLLPNVLDFIHRAKRKRLLDRKGNIRLGIMRHLYVIIDLSQKMNEKDFIPSRQDCVIAQIQGFLQAFFDQNPISQLGILATRDKRAELIAELGGNVRKLNEALQTVGTMTCSGELSLQNALEMALLTLKHKPSHTSREILFLMGSLTSCDPGNICGSMEILKRHQIKVSFISLDAEVFICKTIAEQTGGMYRVSLDEPHLKELLQTYTLPLPSTSGSDSNLIRMGFPSHRTNSKSRSTGYDEHWPSMCICHVESQMVMKGFTNDGYFCPQCRSKYCELPVECKICGLTLVSALHLARSYHHLFPLPAFKEEEISATETNSCVGCMIPIERKQYKCQSCNSVFCIDCDFFLHETLHTCPGCFIK